MEVNYNENNIVNLSNSILKYFNIKPFHNTIPKLDKILETNKYKNVVLLVCDGLGYYNLNELLPLDSFLKRNNKFILSSVFPPTTAAATTTLLSGLTPSEHNYLGWEMYFKDTNETIEIFKNKIKGTNQEPIKKIQDRDYMNYKSIIDLINENKEYKAYYAYPFSNTNKCFNLDEIIDRIKKLSNDDSKKFIYAYIENPDKLMHKYGIYSKEVQEEVKIINEKIEQLSKELKDTIILVTADHGLISTKNIIIKENIPELYNMLERTTSLEPRACGIKLKENINHQEFLNIYNKYLSQEFILMTPDEVLKNKIFGEKESNIIKDNVGDYLLIGINKYNLLYVDNFLNYKANHAGFTKKELMVPLIIIKCDNNK